MEPKKPRTNPKPLLIGVVGIDIQSQPIQDFIQKGHIVQSVPPGVYDVIIGPLCWRIDPRLKLGDDYTPEESLQRQLDMMEKGVRAIKFPKETKHV